MLTLFRIVSYAAVINFLSAFAHKSGSRSGLLNEGMSVGGNCSSYACFACNETSLMHMFSVTWLLINRKLILVYFKLCYQYI